VNVIYYYILYYTLLLLLLLRFEVRRLFEGEPLEEETSNVE